MTRTGADKNQVATGNQATTNQQTNEKANTLTTPPGMAYVPGGEFVMGRDEKDGGDEYERPAHKVTVKPFFIDIYEVTNEDYAKFVKATNHQPPSTWMNGTYAPMGADCLFGAGLDLGQKGKAVVGRCLRKDRAVRSLDPFEVAFFGNRHRGGDSPHSGVAGVGDHRDQYRYGRR